MGEALHDPAPERMRQCPESIISHYANYTPSFGRAELDKIAAQLAGERSRCA
jgi:hypothetical protein